MLKRTLFDHPRQYDRWQCVRHPTMISIVASTLTQKEENQRRKKIFSPSSCHPFAPHPARTDLLYAFPVNLLECEVVELCMQRVGVTIEQGARGWQGTT